MWCQNGDMDLPKTLTFYRSCMAEYFGASKFKEGKTGNTKTCLNERTILQWETPALSASIIASEDCLSCSACSHLCFSKNEGSFMKLIVACIFS